MKRATTLPTLSAVLFLAVMSLCSCTGCGKNAGQTSDADDSAAEFLPDSTFFMLQDEDLPPSVVLSQDISHLGYHNLRLLKSYVYAVHGHWFREPDLNEFFSRHAKWYVDLCYDEWDSGKWPDKDKEWRENYLDALWDDYPKTYGIIKTKLSAEEREFVDRIEERMAELRKHKHIKGEDDATLLNPELMVNTHRLFSSAKQMMTMLRSHNFVIERTECQQLFNVYENNEYLSLPSFITTDVMLQAYHMYFAFVLKTLESKWIYPTLRQTIKELWQASLNLTAMCPEMVVESDRELIAYFTVAMELLGEEPYKMRADLPDRLGWADKTVKEELALIAAQEDAPSPLFHTDTYFCYSMFKPRGHYTRTHDTERYFRAMMWLQKGCYFREKEEQLRLAIRMAQLVNDVPSASAKLRKIDNALRYLMGEPDNVSILKLGDRTPWFGSGVVSDAKVKAIDQWLKKEFAKCNRISPKVKVGPQDQINLLPQRYALDSEILGRMYDPKKDAPRAYPSGLDVMDLMGVGAASSLVADLNKKQPWADYDKERKDMQTRVCEYMADPAQTMYDEWMHSLLTLQKTEKEQPLFMHTKAWSLKGLNTALASWALLKHNAVLYAEQPIAAECGDGGLPHPIVPGYVEPNLPFWKEMKQMLYHCQSVVDECFTPTENEGVAESQHDVLERIADKTKSLMYYVDMCISCSQRELAGKPIAQKYQSDIERFGSEMEWFTLGIICPDEGYISWDMVHGPDRCIAQVSDVFTRNIDGCSKGGILHEATGLANAIYVVVEIDGELYLTRGATYSYYEFVRPLTERLTDEAWQRMVFDNKAPAVPEWFAPLLLNNTTDIDIRFCYSTGC